MILKLKPHVKAKLLAALRSGQYQQGRMSLHKVKLDGNHVFCVMGVMCDIAKDEIELNINHNGISGVVSYNRNIMHLPIEVVKWALEKEAFSNYDGLGRLNVMKDDKVTSLDWLNDNGYTFSQIADLIDAQL